MGNGPGQPRKPTAKLRLHGTERADRRHAGEPTPELNIPEKPVFLKGPAAKEWQRITVELYNQKLLSDLDLAALAGYCHAYGEVIKLDREISKQKKEIIRIRAFLKEQQASADDDDQDTVAVGFGFGLSQKEKIKTKPKKKANTLSSLMIATHSAEYLVAGAKGSLILNPLIKARNAAWKMVLEFGREFGLSPVARTRISVGNADEQNEFLDFQKQYA